METKEEHGKKYWVNFNQPLGFTTQDHKINFH